MKLREAIEVVEQHGTDMVDDPDGNVELVAVGRKGGGPLGRNDDYCVTAFVKQRLSAVDLKERKLSNFAQTFAAATSGPAPDATEIDVVECGSAFVPSGGPGLSVPTPQRGRYGGPVPVLDSQKWFSSLRCGIGITNPIGGYPAALSVGTAGFYMRDPNGDLFVVSNNHVIARSNAAALGEVIVQPGTIDLMAQELRALPTLADLEGALAIADLAAFVPLQFRVPGNIPVNRVDCALAKLRNGSSSGRSHDDVDRLTFAGGIAGVARAFDLREDQSIDGSVRVHKVGRTTGFTEGEVIGIRGTGTIPYPGGNARFENQIVVRATADNVGPFSRQGDSGSGVLNERNELVGLLFAGSVDQTLVNPIQLVIDELRAAAGIGGLEVVVT